MALVLWMPCLCFSQEIEPLLDQAWENIELDPNASLEYLDEAIFLSRKQINEDKELEALEIEVISNNTGGSEWLINGVSYPISDQIQVHTLTGLPANGESLDLHIQVKGNPACQALYENFNTAPMSCASIGTACQGDFNEDGQRNATDLLTFLAVFGVACE